MGSCRDSFGTPSSSTQDLSKVEESPQGVGCEDHRPGGTRRRSGAWWRPGWRMVDGRKEGRIGHWKRVCWRIPTVPLLPPQNSRRECSVNESCKIIRREDLSVRRSFWVRVGDWSSHTSSQWDGGSVSRTRQGPRVHPSDSGFGESVPSREWSWWHTRVILEVFPVNTTGQNNKDSTKEVFVCLCTTIYYFYLQDYFRV